jgi:uncharacterized protein with FMN-binding domain
MRRLLLALASTAAGLAAVLSFKTHSPAAASEATAAPATRTQSGSAAGPASTSRAADSAGTADSAGARVITGHVASTQYGPMQVQVILRGSKITDVKVLQQTDTGTESQQIDANAIPKLNRETLTAQSARIDAVSGASYTSAGYIKSLQSALDKAKA